MNKYIACVASGSAGHIIPTLIYSKKYIKNHNYKILFFSKNQDINKYLNIDVNNLSIEFINLNLINFPYFKIYKYPEFIFSLITSIFKIFYIFYKYKPIKLISTGGYLSIPVAIVAWFFSADIELFELNAIPGKTIKLISLIAKKINVCFRDTIKYLPKNKTVISNYPLRFRRFAIKQIKKTNKTILILGGSQGSQFINNIIINFIELYFNKIKDIEFIHQTGSSDLENIKNFYKNKNLKATIFDYSENLEFYYHLSDIIISRAGSGTIFEIKFFKKQAFLIPLELKNNNHQVYNAKAIAKQYPQYFNIFYQEYIKKNPEKFFKKILSLLDLK